MTTVNTITMPKTGNPGTLPTLPAFTKIGRVLRDRVAYRPASKADPLARQQAIENALSMALWHIRRDSTPATVRAATGRAIRAASMLKQACAESANGGGESLKVDAAYVCKQACIETTIGGRAA